MMSPLNICLGLQESKPTPGGLDAKSFPKEQEDATTKLQPLANSIKLFWICGLKMSVLIKLYIESY